MQGERHRSQPGGVQSTCEGSGGKGPGDVVLDDLNELRERQDIVCVLTNDRGFDFDSHVGTKSRNTTYNRSIGMQAQAHVMVL